MEVSLLYFSRLFCEYLGSAISVALHTLLCTPFCYRKYTTLLLLFLVYRSLLCQKAGAQNQEDVQLLGEGGFNISTPKFRELKILSNFFFFILWLYLRQISVILFPEKSLISRDLNSRILKQRLQASSSSPCTCAFIASYSFLII